MAFTSSKLFNLLNMPVLKWHAAKQTSNMAAEQSGPLSEADQETVTRAFGAENRARLLARYFNDLELNGTRRDLDINNIANFFTH